VKEELCVSKFIKNLKGNVHKLTSTTEAWDPVCLGEDLYSVSNKWKKPQDAFQHYVIQCYL